MGKDRGDPTSIPCYLIAHNLYSTTKYKSTHIFAIIMATPRGLEPLTSGVTGRRSNQLNYEAKLGVFNKETPSSMATPMGFEPTTSSVTGWHSNHLNYGAILQH